MVYRTNSDGNAILTGKEQERPWRLIGINRTMNFGVNSQGKAGSQRYFMHTQVSQMKCLHYIRDAWTFRWLPSRILPLFLMKLTSTSAVLCLFCLIIVKQNIKSLALMVNLFPLCKRLLYKCGNDGFGWRMLCENAVCFTGRWEMFISGHEQEKK